MQFRRPLAEQLDIFKVRADQLSGERWNDGVLQSIDEWHWLLKILQFIARTSDRAIEILAQCVERVPPRVAFIRHELLKNTEGRLFPFSCPVLDRSRNRWSMRKPGAFGQKVSDLQIWIGAELGTTEQFQDQLIA